MTELNLIRKEKIKLLTDFLVEHEDGVNTIGNGKEIFYKDNDIAPLKHSFADGVYIRQMTMQQGTLVVGAIHNHEHVWFLLTGHLTVASKEDVEDFEAPCYVVSPPGKKRVIYANEDSIFVNIHKNPTNTQDLKELEKDIVSLTEEDFNEYIKNRL